MHSPHPFKRRPVFVFDVDGTLLHTGGAGRIAFEKTYEELFGVPRAWQNLVPDGRTDPWIIEELAKQSLGRVLSPAETEVVSRRYLDHFETEIKHIPNFQVLAGVPTFLKGLAAGGFLMGIATGNFERAAWAKLERGSIRPFFQFGGFGSDSASRRVLTETAIQRAAPFAGRLAPDEIVLIGDTVLDVEAGKGLGLRTLAVATGRTPKRILAEAQPDLVVDDLTHFSAILAQLDLR